MKITRRNLLLSLLAAPFVPRAAASYVTKAECDVYASVLARDYLGATTVTYCTRDLSVRAGNPITIEFNGTTMFKGLVESVTLKENV